MIFLATQYSGVPLRFNHKALGELTATLVMNVLLPYYAVLLASPGVHSSIVFYDSRLAMLVIPSALIKFGLFLVLSNCVGLYLLTNGRYGG
jgi:hypothetical protein